MDSLTVKPEMFKKPIDLIFQDGCHETDHCLKELELYYPLLKDIIQETMSDSVNIVDSAHAMAINALEELTSKNLLSESVIGYNEHGDHWSDVL